MQTRVSAFRKGIAESRQARVLMRPRELEKSTRGVFELCSAGCKPFGSVGSL